jgi:hypothetical protein
MDLNALRLVFVRSVGEVGDYPICEFYFSDNADEAQGMGWEYPSAHEVEPPYEEYVQGVFRLTGAPGLKLGLLEWDYERRYFDGVFGLIALCWEEVDYAAANEAGALDERGANLLKLFYGTSFADVTRELARFGGELERVEMLADQPETDDSPLDSGDEDEDDGFPEID